MVHAFVVDGADHFFSATAVGPPCSLLSSIAGWSGRFGVARTLRNTPISIRQVLFDRVRLGSTC